MTSFRNLLEVSMASEINYYVPNSQSCPILFYLEFGYTKLFFAQCSWKEENPEICSHQTSLVDDQYTHVTKLMMVQHDFVVQTLSIMVP